MYLSVKYRGFKGRLERDSKEYLYEPISGSQHDQQNDEQLTRARLKSHSCQKEKSLTRHLFKKKRWIIYLQDAVTSVAIILSRVSGNIVYLSLMNPSKPDCFNKLFVMKMDNALIMNEILEANCLGWRTNLGVLQTLNLV